MRSRPNSRFHRSSRIFRVQSGVLPVAAAILGLSDRAIGALSAWTGQADGTSWTMAGNWTALPPNTAPGNDLIIGSGTVGTINLLGNELANSITFSAGFTLDPPMNSDTLTITTGSVSVGGGIGATINSAIQGNSGLNLSGGGTLTLGGHNVYLGGTTVTAGELIAANASAIPSGTLTVGSGGTFLLNTSSSLPATVVNNGNYDIAGGATMTFTSSVNSFTQNSGSLTVTGVLNMNASPFIDNGGTITGTVNLGSSLSIDSLTLGSGATSGTFLFSGSGFLMGSPGTIGVPSGVSITLKSSSSASLQPTAALTNAGSITLIAAGGINTASLALFSNTMTNSGLLTTSASATMTTPNGIADFVGGPLLNTTGTVQIGASTQFGGNITNNGTFNVASSSTVTFTSTSSNFTQNAGSLTLTGVLSMPSGSFVDNGGTITGTVNLSSSLSTASLTLGSGATSGSFLLSGNSFLMGTPGTIGVPSGVSITLRSSSSASLQPTAALSNAGSITLIAAGGINTASLALFSNTMTNTGVLTTSATASMTTPNGIADFIGGPIVNTTGTVNLNASTQFAGNVVNNSTFDVASGATMTFSGTTGNFTQNAGSLTLTGVLNMPAGVFIDNGGTITGTVNLSSSVSTSSLTLGSGATSGTFLFSGSGFLMGTPGTIGVPSGVSITLQSSSSASLQPTAAVTNAGSITLIAAGGTNTASLALFSQTMTNTGIFTTSASATMTTPNGIADFVGGSLLNTTGTVHINANTQFGGNITNNSTFDVASGSTVTFSGTTSNFTQNAGSLTLTGVLSMPTGVFIDNGGTIAGTVNLSSSVSTSSLTLGSGATSGTFLFSGNGFLMGTPGTIGVPSGVSITLQSSSSASLQPTAAVTNAGTITLVAAGGTNTASLALFSQSMTNTGLLTTSASASMTTPNGVADFIGGSLVNTTGTVHINANTQFAGNITNNGTFNVASGSTVTFSGTTSNFTQNAGSLTLTGVLNMPSGDFADNGGTITGTVNMSSSVSTSSLTLGVGATSGTFVFGGNGFLIGTVPVTVPSGVSITLQATNSASLQPGSGLANAGSITLVAAGGTNTASLALFSQTLTNTGMLTTSASSAMTTVNGVADFIGGPLNNTGTVHINASTQFAGNVTNSGEIDIASAATMTFSGTANGYTQNAGSLTVAANDVLNLSNNPLVLNGGAITLAAGGSATPTPASIVVHSVTFNGSTTTGTIQSGTVGVGQRPGFVDLGATTATFNIGAGTAPAQMIISSPVTDGSLVKTGPGILILSGNNTYAGGTTVANGTLVIGSNNSLPSGSLALTGGSLQVASSVTLTLTSLTISGSGTFDVNNNHLFINYGAGPDPISSIAAMLAIGYNGGAWNGAGGIVSTAAAANSASYGLGYADSADAGNPAGLPSGTIEISYTLLGDTNLDRTVNGVDFGILAANFNKGVSRWDEGDFNYDSAVNGVDFGYLAANFNKGASGAAGDASAADWAALDEFAAANGMLADVPEPGAIGMLTVVAAGLMARRRAGRAKRSRT